MCVGTCKDGYTNMVCERGIADEMGCLLSPKPVTWGIGRLHRKTTSIGSHFSHSQPADDGRAHFPLLTRTAAPQPPAVCASPYAGPHML